MFFSKSLSYRILEKVPWCTLGVPLKALSGYKPKNCWNLESDPIFLYGMA